MKLSAIKQLIREEVRNVMSEAATLNLDKKYYWFEYYPHQSKAAVVVTGKTLMSLKKLYDIDDSKGFNKALAAVGGKKIYFASDVFDESWKDITKSLAAGKAFGDVTEDGSFAISPNSMAEAKKIVREIEADTD